MQLTRTTYRVAVVALLMFAIALPAAACRGETANWGQGADIDAWVYTNYPLGSGVRSFSPTFSQLAINSETNEFERGEADGATRLGMALMAFETTELIAAGLDPSRYSITSVKVTAWARKTGPSASTLIYTDQPLTPAALLAEAQSGSISSQKPFELFGVGFAGGYEGFDLGNATGELLFSEASDPYSGPGHTYVTYPIIGDGEGQYVDVSNSYTGGYSATAETHETDPFVATPWAIGKTNAAVGSVLAGNINYTFDLDLAQPGVVQYVQQSLASGSIGFMLSSMHSTGELGQSGGAYPEWRMREAAAGSAFASLTIEYSILPLLGDYDGNGAVEQADYALWAQTYGSTVTPNTGADGNGDGYIDAADYTVWREAFTATPALAAPEPTACLLAIIGLVNLSLPRQAQKP